MGARWLEAKRRKQSLHKRQRKKGMYDPHSPHAIRTRGAKVIDLVTPIPSDVLVQSRREALLLEWSTWKFKKRIEFHRIVMEEKKASQYLLEMYWEGHTFLFIEEDHYRGLRKRSFVYDSHARAIQAYHIDRSGGTKIRWEQVERIVDT